ncbi:MAG: cytochrome C [Desulfuromonadales bacterium]|nr:MAG: cytochrome C [Desulfuromonadales bacterium]
MRKTLLLLLLAGTIPFSYGCAMFMAWKSIPPPGGCDQCHTVPISANWQVTYQAAYLSDERDRPYFQTDQYSMPQPVKPSSTLDLRKVEELACFECHKTPTPAHKGRVGRFHH